MQLSSINRITEWNDQKYTKENGYTQIRVANTVRRMGL